MQPIRITFNKQLDGISESDIVITAKNYADLFILPEPEYTFELVDDNEVIEITITNVCNAADYTVIIKAGITADSGDWVLKEDYVFKFRTPIIPFYTTVRAVRSRLGNLISNVTDEEIQYLIYVESYNLSQKYDITEPPHPAAGQYVLCKVQYELLKRRIFEGGPITTKRLADLQISRGSAFSDMIKDLLEDLEDCMTVNEAILAGDDLSFNAVTAVKAKNDPRRPITDTSWRRYSKGDF